MSNTANYNLTTWSSSETGDSFNNFLFGVAGDTNSNMTKIDAQMKLNADAISSVKSYPIKSALATRVSDSYYTAVVSDYSAYVSGNVLVLLLDTTSSATLTININSIGTVSVMKYDLAGSLANVEPGEVVANYPTLIRYDGTRWIIIGHGVAGQIITTSGNSVQYELNRSIKTVTTTTPTSITGILIGNGSVISSASAGENYLAPVSAPTNGHVLTTDAAGVPIDSGHALTEYAPYTSLTHKQLLLNWDWRTSPVNQPNLSGGITSGYVYDQWLRYAGTITIAPTYLSIPAGAAVEQRIESNALSGASVVVSVMVGGEVISGTGTFPTSEGTASVTLTGFGTATLGYATGYMYIRYTATASTRQVQAVKLELGTYSTLANDPPANYGEQLALCQRYLLWFTTNKVTRSAAYGANTIDFIVPIPVTMRITPSIDSTLDFTVYTAAGSEQSGFTFAVRVANNSILNIRATKTSHGITDATLGITTAGAITASL